MVISGGGDRRDGGGGGGGGSGGGGGGVTCAISLSFASELLTPYAPTRVHTRALHFSYPSSLVPANDSYRTGLPALISASASMSVRAQRADTFARASCSRLLD